MITAYYNEDDVLVDQMNYLPRKGDKIICEKGTYEVVEVLFVINPKSQYVSVFCKKSKKQY